MNWIARRHPITNTNRETVAFVVVLGICLAGFFHETLLGDKVMSPADVLLVSASFRDEATGDYEPANRLLMDPVLQFQPWLDFNRTDGSERPTPALEQPRRLRCSSSRQRPECRVRPIQPDRIPRSDAEVLCLDGGRPAAGRGSGDVLAGTVLGSRILGTVVCGTDLSVLRIPGRLAPVSRNAGRDLDALAIPGHRSPVPGSRAKVGGRPRRDRRPSFCSAATSRRARTSCWRSGCTSSGESGPGAEMGRVPADLALLGGWHWPGSSGGGDPDPAAGGLSLQEPGLGRPSTREAALVGRRITAMPRRRLYGDSVRIREPAIRPSQPGSGLGRAQPE